MWIVGWNGKSSPDEFTFYGAFRTVNSIERSQESRWVNCYLDAIMGKFSIKIMCQIKKIVQTSFPSSHISTYSGYQVVNIWALKKGAAKSWKITKRTSQMEMRRFLWVCPFWAEGVSSQTHKKGMIFKGNAQESVKKFYFFELWPHQREY